MINWDVLSSLAGVLLGALLTCLVTFWFQRKLLQQQLDAEDRSQTLQLEHQKAMHAEQIESQRKMHEQALKHYKATMDHMKEAISAGTFEIKETIRQVKTSLDDVSRDLRHK